MQPLQPFVNVHGVEHRLVETGLELVRHNQNPILRTLEGVGDGDARRQTVHAVLGVVLSVVGVVHRAAEGDQTAVGEIHLAHLLPKFLLVADAVKTGSRNQHRPTLTPNRLRRVSAEVFKHNLRLRLNAVRL